MAKITYNGPSHFRVLLSADFAKWDLALDDHRFARYEATEVDDDTAEAIMKYLPGEFTSAGVEDKQAELPIDEAIEGA